MKSATVLLVVVGTALLAGCTDGDTAAEPAGTTTATSVAAVPTDSADTLAWSDTVPFFAMPPPVEPLVMTIVDEDAKECLEVRQRDGSTAGMCVDEPEELAVTTTQPDLDGTVYLLGLTNSDTASYAIATAGESVVRVELRNVDDWSSRAFVAPLEFMPETVQLVDATGGVVAQQNL